MDATIDNVTFKGIHQPEFAASALDHIRRGHKYKVCSPHGDIEIRPQDLPIVAKMLMVDLGERGFYCEAVEISNG